MKSFENRLVDYIPRLRRYARALCSNVYAADDLVQDTLERALNKKSLWKSNSRLRPWLFTIMHNLYVNQLRHHSSQPHMLELEEKLHEVPDTPESQAYAQQLLYNIARLPEDQKEAFLLVSLEGFAYEEVADIMSIPVGTVMSRLSRAREKLRRQINTPNTAALRRVK